MGLVLCGKIAALKHVKIYIPQDHVDGDDIWICTLDGTMFTSWEIAGTDRAKDPIMYNHKNKCAGFNAEVAVSVKESRCIWINVEPKKGMYFSGSYVLPH